MEAKLKIRSIGYMGVPLYKEVDYTGRWKIISNVDSKYTQLHIECFEIEELDDFKDATAYRKVYTYDKWYHFFIGKLKERVESHTIKVSYKHIHAKVYWIDSNNLIVSYAVEEIIYSCGGLDEEHTNNI